MFDYVKEVVVLALTAVGSFGIGLCLSRKMAAGQNHANFEGFVQNINEGCYRSSLEGKQLFGNNALVRLNGYNSEAEFLAAVGDIATEWYVEPDRREQFKILLEENGYVENFVSEIYRHKTRERIWISENARVVCDDSGRPMYYEGTIREHTETMKRLQMQELHTRLADQIPGVLFKAKQVRGEAFEVPYVSSGSQEMFGISSKEIEKDASSVADIVHVDDLEDLVIAAQRSAKAMEPLNHQFRISPKNGPHIWVEVSATPLRARKRTTLWYGVILDITAKKTAELKVLDLAGLQQSEPSPKRPTRAPDDLVASQTGSKQTARAQCG